MTAISLPIGVSPKICCFNKRFLVYLCGDLRHLLFRLVLKPVPSSVMEYYASVVHVANYLCVWKGELYNVI